MSTPGSESEIWKYYVATMFAKPYNSYKNQLLEIKFYDISRCQISSLMISDASASLPTCLGSFSRSLLLEKKISGWLWAFSCEENASHPLSLCKKEYPKFHKSEGPHESMVETPFSRRFLRSYRIKMKNLDIDHDDFRRTFQLCPPEVLNARTEGTISPRC